jgi:hypothetical protein
MIMLVLTIMMMKQLTQPLDFILGTPGKGAHP